MGVQILNLPAKRANRKKAGKAAPARAEALGHGRLDGLLGYHLRKAQQAMFKSFAAALDGEEISPGQLGVLLMVAANAGVNQTRVGAAMGIDRSTLVAVLDRLETRDLIERAPSPTDRRSHALMLTARGSRYLDELLPRVEAHERDLAGDLSDRERETLIGLLRRLKGV
jgi:DNA-binding MarR family transcriptional regulator